MDWGAVRRGVPGSEGGGGGDKSGGHRPHGDDERAGEPAGWLALAVGDEHRHVGALLEVPHRDACGNERTLEGEAAAGQEGDQVIPPVPGDVSWLGHQVPVLPDPVRGQVRAQVGAGRQARRRVAGHGHVEQRARAGVAADEPLELAGGVLRQDDQVGLSEPRRAARGRHPHARPEASANSGWREVFQRRQAGGSGRAESAGIADRHAGHLSAFLRSRATGGTGGPSCTSCLVRLRWNPSASTLATASLGIGSSLRPHL